MKNDAPPSHVDIVSFFEFLIFANIDIDQSTDQCWNCLHFNYGICDLGLSLALDRDSDVCGWYNCQ
jgi:hypothetical protein